VLSLAPAIRLSPHHSVLSTFISPLIAGRSEGDLIRARIGLLQMRVGIVGDMNVLSGYLWTGHSALMGKVKRDWQDTQTVLAYFGGSRREAVLGYKAFVRDGISQGGRPELVGGGLIRSRGGWSQVLSLRRKGEGYASDDRILGRSEFVESLLAEVDEREKETLRLSRKILDLESLAREIVAGAGLKKWELRSGSRQKKISRARRLFCQLAVRKMGYPGAQAARFLGVSTSAVIRAAHSEELPEIENY
jgi:putative transposase